MLKLPLSQSRRAIYLPLILLITLAFITLSTVTIEYALLQRKTARFNQAKLSALGAAEAGISYYLWHLSHNGSDYSDGQSVPANAPYGPYVHPYQDADGNIIGSYSLLITPPPNGSTLVTIESTGQITSTGKQRTVKALLGIPSFSTYAVVSGGEMWFRDDDVTNGPVHSNVGIRFDGVNNGLVTAANATYVPSVNFGGNGNQTQNGVWGSGGPQSQWLFPVPAVNFQQISANLNTLKSAAQTNGRYLPKSANLGYYVQFQSDGTYLLSQVTAYSFNTFTTTPAVSFPAPANGIIFAEDEVYVSGNIKGRFTVAAATLPSNPSTNRSITITNNLTYSTKDGSDVLGLVGQQDVKAGPMTPSDLEVDGALLAQNGKVFRPCRWNLPDEKNCFKGNGNNQNDTYNLRNNLLLYGSIASFGIENWNWNAGNDGVTKSGYPNVTDTYDSNLLYGPPPSFPTTGKYSLLSWRELTSP